MKQMHGLLSQLQSRSDADAPAHTLYAARLLLADGTTVKSNLTSSLPYPNTLPYPNPLQGQMHIYPRKQRTISITMGPFLRA